MVERKLWLNSVDVILLWSVFIGCLRKHSAVTQQPKGNTGHIIRQLTGVLHATMCDKRKTEGPNMYHFSFILLNALQRKNSLFTCIRKVPKCLKLMRIIEFVLCVMCLSGSHVTGSEAETINSRPIGYTVLEIRIDFIETYSFVLTSSSNSRVYLKELSELEIQCSSTVCKTISRPRAMYRSLY